MPRTFAPIVTSIWMDEGFRSLPALAQRVYILAFSQPEISYCGVVSFTARRWARMACDTKVSDIEEAVAVLEERRFVVLDEDTEELFVRSFVKHNNVLTQPQLKKSMLKAYEHIDSKRIR